MPLSELIRLVLLMNTETENNSDDKCLVYFIRHGLTQANLERKYIGSRSNPGLSSDSRLLIAERVRSGEVPEINSLWISPMRRALETAKLYFPQKQALVSDDLKERDFGIWDGLTWEDLKDIELYRRFIDTEGRVTPPEGEPYEDYARRLDLVLEKIKTLIAEEPGYFPLAIVCHGGPVRYWTGKVFEKGEEFHNYMLSGAGCLAIEVAAADLKITSVYDFYSKQRD